jgi:predicted transcriptional regulator
LLGATFKLKPPCFIVTRYILPAVNARIAMELTEKYGMKRSDVAEKMGITPAAVTLYLNQKRGNAAIKLINSSEEAVKLIAKIADYLANSKFSTNDGILSDICEVCQIIRVSGLIRKMRKDITPCVKGEANAQEDRIKESGIQEKSARAGAKNRIIRSIV